MDQRLDHAENMKALLGRQKAAHLDQGAPDYDLRIDRMDRCISALVSNKDHIADAMSEDFGHRSKDQSSFTDVAASIDALNFAKKRLRKWMKPEKRQPIPPLGFLGAKAWVEFQPKGVIGVVSPWNFPVNLTFVPLAGVLAAGNRSMIKPSEFTPATSELMK